MRWKKVLFISFTLAMTLGAIGAIMLMGYSFILSPH